MVTVKKAFQPEQRRVETLARDDEIFLAPGAASGEAEYSQKGGRDSYV